MSTIRKFFAIPFLIVGIVFVALGFLVGGSASRKEWHEKIAQLKG